MLKKSLLFILSGLVIAVILLESIWIHLSPDRLKPWLEHQINLHLQPKLSLRIGSVDPRYWGLQLNQIQLENRSSKAILLQLQTVQFRFSPISLLIFREIPYFIQLYEGTIRGGLGFLPNYTLSFKAAALQLNRNPVIRKSGLILSDPQLNASGNIHLDTPPLGTISFGLTELSLSGDPEVTHLPLELPQTRFSSLQASARLLPQEIEIQGQSSGDIAAGIKGVITPDWNRLVNSRLDLQIQAEFDNAFQTRLGFVKSILQGYLTPQGRLSLQMSGTLASPRIKRI